jgi:plasmid maintenance system antidote protein VapI
MKAHELLKALMLSEGVLQKGLAKELKIHAGYMSAILSGRKPITVVHAKVLERVLGVPAIVFLYMQEREVWETKIKLLESI